MGGCRLKPNPCTTPNPPTPDPRTAGEEANAQIVQDLINRVWNHSWTPTEEAENDLARASGIQTYVPQSVSQAINDLRSTTMVRHREDALYGRVKADGPDDYRACVNAVHAVAPDLYITVLHLITDDDRVVAHLLLEGTDIPVDQNAPEGVFGNRPPSRKKFSIQATAMYRLSEGKIEEDWLGYGGTPVYS